jgi:phosphocarrier protein
MLRKKIIIINKLGLHARAAAKFVATASRFSCKIEIAKGEQVVNGKSIMGVMMLAATQGTEVELIVDGEDSEEESEALQALIELINNRFGEDK